MAVLWLVLKVIAVSFIAVFALLLLTLGLILFLPIRYHIFFEKDDESYCAVRVNLFKIVKIKYIWEKEQGNTHIYLFGREIKKARSADTIKKESPKDPQSALKEEADKKRDDNETKTVQAAKKSFVNKKINGREPKEHQRVNYTDEKTLKEKVKFYLEYIKSDYFKGFFESSIRLIKTLYKMIKPSIIRFNLVLGRGDPAETGEMMSKIILFYPLYYRYGVIEGAYDEEILAGNLTLLGKMILFDLLKALLLFILNKDARRYIQFIMNRREEE